MYICTSVTVVRLNSNMESLSTKRYFTNKLQVQDRCLALCHEPIHLDSLEKRRNDSDMYETYKN